MRRSIVFENKTTQFLIILSICLNKLSERNARALRVFVERKKNVLINDASLIVLLTSVLCQLEKPAAWPAIKRASLTFDLRETR